MDCDESIPEDEAIPSTAANPMKEDPPLILNSINREVFHVFANMLDVKSFVRLAMASKEMYERCVEDKMIRIDLEEKEVSVRVVNGTLTFSFYSFNVTDKNIEKYLESLRQLTCNVSLTRLHFHAEEIDAVTIMETRRYLEELSVKKINFLKIDGQFTGWKQVPFIKDFHFENVDIGGGLPEDVLQSLIQLNLSSFTYHGLIDGNMLLNVDSPIPQITLPSIQLSVAVFTQILWKIQTGALTRLSVNYYDIPWRGFTQVPENHDGTLPEERPLLIYAHFGNRRWFLHWDGAVTLCEEGLNHFVEIAKCSSDLLPLALKSKESVHKALAEKDFGIECFKRHFISFFDGIPVLDASYKGPFPEERPLLCKGGTSQLLLYYVLNEDGSVDIYNFDGRAHFTGKYDLEEKLPHYIIGHTPLQKLVFDKRIEKRVMKKFECDNVKEFRFLFKKFKPLPYDFRGQLPERRPLVFEGTMHSSENDYDYDETEQEFRIVLFEDGTVIHYRCENDISIVHINHCSQWYFPSALIVAKVLKEIVLHAPLSDFNYFIDHDVFRDSFKGMRTLPFHAYAYGCFPTKPFIFKKTAISDGKVIDQRWLVLNEWDVRKCEWKDGQVTLTKGDGKDYPPILTKVMIQDFFDGKSIVTDCIFLIDRIVLYGCIEDLKIFDYDDEPPLDDLPLIFQKEEIKHTCQEDSNDDCDCIEDVLHLWLVDKDYFVVQVTWGVEGDRQLAFCYGSQATDMPPSLRDKEMLDYLLQETSARKRKMPWYGSLDDFRSYSEGHMTVDFNQESPLPETRPLVFKEKRQTSDFWFLRKDDVLIQCEWLKNFAWLTVSPKKNLPVALRCEENKTQPDEQLSSDSESSYESD